MIYAYTRVSTQNQVLSRQEDAIVEYALKKGLTVDKWHSDKMSGKTFARDSYLEMKSVLRSGDTLIIKEIDRLSRNYDGIKEEWRWFMDNDINVVVVDMPLLTTGLSEGNSLDGKLIANIVFELLCYLAEKERQKISERTKEGLASAKQRGSKLGHPKKDTYDTDKAMIQESLRKGEKWSDFCARTGIKRSYYYEIKRELAGA